MTQEKRPNPMTGTRVEDEQVAGNGLLHRRTLLQSGATAVGAFLAGTLLNAIPKPAAAAEASAGTKLTPWLTTPGAPPSGYGKRSPHEDGVVRVLTQGYKEVAPGAGWSMTPLQNLHGTITPNSLHFERHHAGIPAIDPAQHKLLIHGMVKRPLMFTMDRLARYPTVSRIHYLECSGNSYPLLTPEPQQKTAGEIHGLLSCAEWTGVLAAQLLEEAGVDPRAKWVHAEGADAASMVRSIPIEKMRDDALLAMFQNGEAIRPDQGYPLRLFLPGFEGNTSVKWLRQLKVSDRPAEARDETSKYTDLMPNGKALQHTLVMGVKSVITQPSGNMQMKERGFYEISGLAWTGTGHVKKVEVSADGGKTWAEAALYGQEHKQGLTRFRLPWKWDGGPATLLSRATDDKGHMQETRDKWIARNGAPSFYHFNAIQSWEVTASGSVRNVYV